MGAFDFLKSSGVLKDIVIDVLSLLVKNKASRYADEQAVEIIGGLRNQGYAEKTPDGWIVKLTLYDTESGEEKMESLINLMRAINKSVTWVTKHGGPYPAK